MADALPSPPETPRSTPEATTDDLTTRLDGLLEHYLDLLDQYTKLRDDLSKTFSSGFFSLAQAQRSSTLGAGRRYGEEYYDERMKAQRKVTWQHGTDPDDLVCKIERVQKKDDSKDKDDVTKQTFTNDLNLNEESGKGKEKQRQDIDSKDQPRTSDKSSKTARPKQDPGTRDPLTWFGILVPPALRQTQAQFIKVVEDQIPALIAIASRLRSTEGQIWELREELGILSEYDHEEAETETEDLQPIGVKEIIKTTETTREGDRTSRKPLASRPAHSKSHLLKLGD